MSDNNQRIFIIPFSDAGYELLVYGADENEVSRFLKEQPIELAIQEIVFDPQTPPLWKNVPPVESGAWRTALLSEEMLNSLLEQPYMNAEQVIRQQFEGVELLPVDPFMIQPGNSPWDEWSNDDELQLLLKELEGKPEGRRWLDAAQAALVGFPEATDKPDLMNLPPEVANLAAGLQKRIDESGSWSMLESPRHVAKTTDLFALETDNEAATITSSDLHVEIRQNKDAAGLAGDLRVTVHMKLGNPSESQDLAFASVAFSLALLPGIQPSFTRAKHSYRINGFKSVLILYHEEPGPIQLNLQKNRQPLVLQCIPELGSEWIDCEDGGNDVANWLLEVTGKRGHAAYQMNINGTPFRSRFKL